MIHRSAWTRWLAALFGLVVVLFGVGIPTANAAPLRVSYDVSSGIAAELRHPGGSLPGTNDFHCLPSRTHPRPVILVHGSGGGRQTNWGTLAPVLYNAGYCVFAPTYGALTNVWPASAIGGMGPKIDSAWDIKLFAESVLASTGARQVDLVGHSLGTEIPTYWLRYLGGASKVAHYVSLAPYWRQGPDEDDARSDAVAQFRRLLGIPGEAHPVCPECTAPPGDLNFNAAVRHGSPYLPGIRYTNIVTRHDEIVTPYTNGILAGPPGTDVRNVVVQDGCAADHSGHLGLTASRRASAMVLSALDPEYAPAIPCVPIAQTI